MASPDGGTNRPVGQSAAQVQPSPPERTGEVPPGVPVEAPAPEVADPQLLPVPKPRRVSRATAAVEAQILKFDRPYVWPIGAAFGGLLASRVFALAASWWNAAPAALGLVLIVFCLWAGERRKIRIKELTGLLAASKDDHEAALRQLRATHQSQIDNLGDHRETLEGRLELVTESLTQTQAWIDKLVARAVARCYREYGLTSTERVTFLRYSNRETSIVGRHCDDDTYLPSDGTSLRSRRFPRKYGVIGRALSQNSAWTVYAPESDDRYKTYEQWQQIVGRLPATDVATLTMRSQTYAAVAIYASSGDVKVGVVVIESTKADYDAVSELFDALKTHAAPRSPTTGTGIGRPAAGRPIEGELYPWMSSHYDPLFEPPLTGAFDVGPEPAPDDYDTDERPADSDPGRDRRTHDEIRDLLELVATMPSDPE